MNQKIDQATQLCDKSQIDAAMQILYQLSAEKCITMQESHSTEQQPVMAQDSQDLAPESMMGGVADQPKSPVRGCWAMGDKHYEYEPRSRSWDTTLAMI